jgi:hypothetical protein
VRVVRVGPQRLAMAAAQVGTLLRRDLLDRLGQAPAGRNRPARQQVAVEALRRRGAVECHRQARKRAQVPGGDDGIDRRAQHAAGERLPGGQRGQACRRTDLRCVERDSTRVPGHGLKQRERPQSEQDCRENGPFVVDCSNHGVP